MKRRLVLSIQTSLCGIFLLTCGVVLGDRQGTEYPWVKQPEDSNIHSSQEEQSVSLSSQCHSRHESVQRFFDCMECQDSHKEVYPSCSEEVHATYVYEFTVEDPISTTLKGERDSARYGTDGVQRKILFEENGAGRYQSSSSRYDGEWSGTTNQGNNVSFTVSDNCVTAFKIKLTVRGSYCSVTMEGTFSVTPPWAISGNGFTITGGSTGTHGNEYTYEGTFISDTTASGTWYYKDNYCKGSESGTWQTSLQGSEPPEGALVTSNLWIGSFIITDEKGPIEAVWQKGGEATTSRGDRVLWGYFYASPDDVTWGSINNPDLFVKIWFDVSGRVDVNYFHVSVPDIEVYSDYPYDGSPDEKGTTTMSRRYIRQYYENGQSNFSENYEDGNPPGGYSPNGSPSGFSTANELRIGSMINTVEIGPIDAVWRLGGQDSTARGDHVVWGHFYASPDDVAWGSENNPDLFVKIWFDVSGRVDVNFFHVSVPDIEVYSDLPNDGVYDQKGTTIMNNRYIRQEYWR